MAPTASQETGENEQARSLAAALLEFVASNPLLIARSAAQATAPGSPAAQPPEAPELLAPA